MRCGRTHTAARPEGARPGPVGYGPNLAAFAVYLMVVHFLPAHRVVALLESLTGGRALGRVRARPARPHRRAAGRGARPDPHPDHPGATRCAVDETPLKVGPRTPRPGKNKAERYLLVACTELYTHYLLGDRSLDTFKAFVLAERAQRGAVVVHDRYQNYDSRRVRRAGPPALLRSIYCVILTTPPRSTPTRSGRSRSPTRCAS